ncbi:MAG: aminopeptidase [Deltaproteobacteria bacterium]|nr:aminopeptidase [Deltaproteobacteria bacterium]MBW2075219.1 aminopeptidase [Deltaproteobacteria bacterium]RLB80533.1 MAG: aminopeptidase [Deltaproteobacteria bacterium]
MKGKLSKKEVEQLRKRLFRKPQLVWDVVGPGEKNKVLAFAERYKSFLDAAKTEREAVRLIEAFSKKKGFKDITRARGGKRFYKINRNKNIALAVIGKRPLISGVNLVASHIDAPRLDLKQNPIYEEVDLAFLKTHYYGGIKKYQWLARPLAIHGKVLKKDGSHLDLQVGESDDDPVFTIADLLPHLARKVQTEKKVSEAFEGEKLNVLVGSLPLGDDKIKERFKLALLEYLFTTYGIVEEDLVSSEIEIVPAGRARDVGWDRSLIGAYGQDDRVCAYASLEAVGELKTPETTAVALFIDKEEIGSDGSTGAKSRFLEDFVADLFEVTGKEATGKALRSCLISSRALSADVNGALDPDYQDVHEKRNAARIGYGVCITKFTGSGGKYGSSDANAEYLGQIRKLFNENKVVWQTGELGKVDEGGGGTIAKFLAIYGMEVLDCGTPLLSMHSPFEIASKADIYMTYKGYQAFFNSKQDS